MEGKCAFGVGVVCAPSALVSAGGSAAGLGIMYDGVVSVMVVGGGFGVDRHVGLVGAWGRVTAGGCR